MTTRDAVFQYTIGFFGTGTLGVVTGADIMAALPLATVLPAIALLIVNLPKMARELLLLYREYKYPDSTPRQFPDGSSDKGDDS